MNCPIRSRVAFFFFFFFLKTHSQVFRYSGIQVFYCIIAFETAMRQQNFAKQKLNRER